MAPRASILMDVCYIGSFLIHYPLSKANAQIIKQEESGAKSPIPRTRSKFRMTGQISTAALQEDDRYYMQGGVQNNVELSENKSN
jgi:hypothetical protein